jgi:hypothetical protein
MKKRYLLTKITIEILVKRVGARSPTHQPPDYFPSQVPTSMMWEPAENEV